MLSTKGKRTVPSGSVRMILSLFCEHLFTFSAPQCEENEPDAVDEKNHKKGDQSFTITAVCKKNRTDSEKCDQ